MIMHSQDSGDHIQLVEHRCMKRKNPLVSICTITYNHSQYIKECLDGFLMQRTNFQFEVLIHDDASTDGTEEIIREYEAKYPEIIKPIYEKENQWVKGRRGSMVFNLPRSRGKYIALCEGDDYWTDPLKLQKQVDFLEANEEYGLVHANGIIKNLKNGEVRLAYKNRDHLAGKDVFTMILLGKYSILTCSACFRKDLYTKLNITDTGGRKFLMGDTLLWLELSKHSKVKYIDETMVVHNHLEESASKSKDMRKILSFSMSGYELEKYIAEKYNVDEIVKKEIDIRRFRIFLDISYRGGLKKEGEFYFNELKRRSTNIKLQINDYLKVLSLKFSFLSGIINLVIKIMARIGAI